jgi:hypothetical protein
MSMTPGSGLYQPDLSVAHWIGQSIATHPTQPGTLWIIQDRKVFRSDNRGTTWDGYFRQPSRYPLNTTGVLPPSSGWTLTSATDLGVFTGLSYGDWMPFSNGLPYTAEITELEIWY